MNIPSNMKSIQDQLAADFEYLDDWEERYAYLMDLGKEVQGLSPEEKTSDNLIRGCQSRVWLITRYENNRYGCPLILKPLLQEASSPC